MKSLIRTSKCASLCFLLTMVLATTGCSSLSLFSSRHVHYHGSKEADDKITDLEKRVEALEAKQK